MSPYRVYHRAAFELIFRFLFQYGRVNIETANKKRGIIDHTDEEQEPEPEPDTVEKAATPPMPKKNGLSKKLSVNGLVRLISKESLVLVPEGDHKEPIEVNGDNENNVDRQVINVFGCHLLIATADKIPTACLSNSACNSICIIFSLQEIADKVDKQLDFKIEDCLEYLKSGVEAIIEDDVTSRFEAEELKNWNLLTRTNRKYEFISWKLTVIWVIGFLIRYLLLMPLRVIICFIGVSFLTLFLGKNNF